ncbi:MAG: N-acetyl-gamma-glutamyl-phosphate reductase [Deltaproteobacteria bacterium]|nr:N-acetyl-gamma-glutamyl-phosphate reductase [Deltaproteobacteria bacterium]
MQTTPIAILGASGYSGMEAARILAFHPRADVRVLSSDRWDGDTGEKRLGLSPKLTKVGALKFTGWETGYKQALEECEAVLLALPAEASLEFAPKLIAAGKKVVDFSGAFRLQDLAVFEKAYALQHKDVAPLREAVYAMTEIPGTRAKVKSARLVSNPGCFPTAASLSVAPLLQANLLAHTPIIFDAKSGVTGAGRKASEDFSFSELNDGFKAYRVLKHQHTPEIAQVLAQVAGRPVSLTFTAHLLPVRRGILCTAYAQLAPGVSAGAIKEALVAAYASEPFVRVVDDANQVRLRNVVGTNACEIGVSVGDSFGLDPGRVVVTSAIDNLVKGAAGQAVQNLNLQMGWDESCGLDALRGHHP